MEHAQKEAKVRSLLEHMRRPPSESNKPVIYFLGQFKGWLGEYSSFVTADIRHEIRQALPTNPRLHNLVYYGHRVLISNLSETWIDVAGITCLRGGSSSFMHSYCTDEGCRRDAEDFWTIHREVNLARAQILEERRKEKREQVDLEREFLRRHKKEFEEFVRERRGR